MAPLPPRLPGYASNCILPVTVLCNLLSAGRVGGERPSRWAGSPRRGALRRCHRGGHPPPRRPRPAHRWPWLAGGGDAPASPLPRLPRLLVAAAAPSRLLLLPLLGATVGGNGGGGGRGGARCDARLLLRICRQLPLAAAAAAPPPSLFLRSRLAPGPAWGHRHGGAAWPPSSFKSDAGQATAGPTWPAASFLLALPTRPSPFSRPQHPEGS